MLIRLNKYLSDSGVCSRRKADEHILAGDIEVNGTIIKVLGTKIDPEKDLIKYLSKPVKPQNDFTYYALYKPKGVVSTASDELGRPTVISLVPDDPRVYPVGRLDEDSEGLIILTNDGALTQQLTHPSYKHEKEYEVTVRVMDNELRAQNDDIRKNIKDQFETGMRIDGKFMKADKATVSIIHNSNFIIQMVLHTGYNRQVRKMCAKIGLAVTKLVRTKIANLSLSKINLASGKYININKAEIL